MRLEVVVLSDSDVDRARDFYRAPGWRLDAGFPADEDFRVVQLTPPGSACSNVFGTAVTSAAPGSAHGLQLVVPGPAEKHKTYRSWVSFSDREETGQADRNWPDWYAQHMADESAGQAAGS